MKGGKNRSYANQTLVIYRRLYKLAAMGTPNDTSPPQSNSEEDRRTKARERVLTLVAPQLGILIDPVVDAVREALDAENASPSRPYWLSQTKAVDIFFHRITPEWAVATAQKALEDLKVDIIAQRTATRRKKLLLADMDSTIVREETLDEIAARAGKGDEVAGITARAMQGELEFAEALRERVEMLAGQKTDLLADVLGKMRLTPGAVTLVQTMRSYGAKCVLVTGGFDYFAERVSQLVGFDHFVANSLIIENDTLTGQVREPINDGSAKLRTLKEFQETLGLEPDEAMAVGDGANDLQMIRAAGLGVSYYGKPGLEAACHNRIRHCDLTALLYAQGYHETEIT